jgi:hypothetical protein
MGVIHNHPQRVAEVPQDPKPQNLVPAPFGQSASLQLSSRVPGINSSHDGVVVSDRRGKNWEVPDVWFHKCSPPVLRQQPSLLSDDALMVLYQHGTVRGISDLPTYERKDDLTIQDSKTRTETNMLWSHLHLKYRSGG